MPLGYFLEGISFFLRSFLVMRVLLYRLMMITIALPLPSRRSTGLFCLLSRNELYKNYGLIYPTKQAFWMSIPGHILRRVYNCTERYNFWPHLFEKMCHGVCHVWIYRLMMGILPGPRVYSINLAGLCRMNFLQCSGIVLCINWEATKQLWPLLELSQGQIASGLVLADNCNSSVSIFSN